MGRPRVHGDRVTTAIRFEKELHERLESAAIERDVSINWLVSRAVEQFLDRLIPVDQMEWTRE
jgi:predicted HicB family RNase H-like nuclease